MGMFDTVIVEGLKLKAPKEVTSFLKDNNVNFPTEYQTKDLVCALHVYKIKDNGDIFEEVRKSTGKKIPYKPPFLGWNNNRPYLEKIYWYFKNKKYSTPLPEFVDETKAVYVKTKLTDTFAMLSYDEVGGRYISLDYEVKAVEGKVKSIKLLEWSIESEKESLNRHKENKMFNEKRDASFAKRKAFQSKWYYPILKEVYNPFLFFSKLVVQNICNILVRWSYRWTGV